MLHAVNHLWLIRTRLHSPFISLLCSPQEEAVCCVLLEAENMFMFLPRHSAGEMLMCVCAGSHPVFMSFWTTDPIQLRVLALHTAAHGRHLQDKGKNTIINQSLLDHRPHPAHV